MKFFKDYLNVSHISPHFSRPVDLKKQPDNMFNNGSNENSDNGQLKQEVQRLKEALRKTRKENMRKVQEMEESYKSQFAAQAEVYLFFLLIYDI